MGVLKFLLIIVVVVWFTVFIYNSMTSYIDDALTKFIIVILMIIMYSIIGYGIFESKVNSG